MKPKSPKPSPSSKVHPAIFLVLGAVIGGAAAYFYMSARPVTLVISPSSSAKSKHVAPAKAGVRVDSRLHGNDTKPSFVPPAPPARVQPKARIAIVLDDWGYNLEALPLAKEIDRPLTLAVLPLLPYSTRVATEGAAEGHEIILHMPMEAKNSSASEKATIFTGTPKDEVRRTVLACLEDLPNVDGVSNHQGSKATEDREIVHAVLETVRDKKLFFLDSLTTQNSVAGSVAAELSVPFLKRDVFLDNVRTEEAVQKQMDELKAVALKNESAIGIGHDETVTLEAIQKNIPQWEKEGIEVVRLSDLLKTETGGKKT